MVVDFDKYNVTANMKSFVFPVAFSQGAGDIIPQVGVLVFFKRSYIKSVYPIFFNPSDPALFAKTLTERIKNEWVKRYSLLEVAGREGEGGLPTFRVLVILVDKVDDDFYYRIFFFGLAFGYHQG